jgi:hypothetical protein
VASREDVGIDIVAHDMASAALKDVGSSLTGVGTSAKGTSEHVTALGGTLDGVGKSPGFQSIVMGVGMGAGMMAWNAVGNSIGDVVGFLQGAVQAAIEDEAVETRLRAALEANVPAWNGNVDAIDRVIASRLRLGFTDDEQKAALTLLVAQTGDVTKALDIQRVAMDLARLKGIGLAEASKAVVMGMQGQGRSLIELGIKVKDYASAADIMAAIEAKAAGQAEEFTTTTAGSLAAMNVQIDEASRAIGEALTPLVAVAAQGLAAFAKDAAPVAVAAIHAIGDTASNTAKEVDNLNTILKTLNGTNIGPDAKPAQFDLTPQSVFGQNLGPVLANLGLLGAANQEAEARRQYDAQQQLESIRRLNEGYSQVAAAVGVVTLATIDTSHWMDSFALAEQRVRDQAYFTVAVLPLLAQGFRDAARAARDNRLDDAWDLKELPLKILIAKDDIVAAAKAVNEARSAEDKRAAQLRLLEAKRNVQDLVNQLSDAKTDAAAAGSGVGTAFGGGLFAEISRSGVNIGKAFADGLRSQEATVAAAAAGLASAATDRLRVKSPAKVGPLAEDQSLWGETLGKTWVAGLQRGLATYAQLPALADVRLTLQGGGSAPIAPPLGRVVGPAAVGGGSGGTSAVYLNVTVAGGIVDPTGTIGQQIADSLILPLRRALDRNGIGLAAR